MGCVVYLVGDPDDTFSIQVNETKHITFEFLLSWPRVLMVGVSRCSYPVSALTRSLIFGLDVFFSCLVILRSYIIVSRRARNIVLIFKSCNRLYILHGVAPPLLIVHSLRDFGIIKKVRSLTIKLIIRALLYNS